MNSVFLRRRDSIHIETATNRLTQFDHIASPQLAKELRRGASDRFHRNLNTPLEAAIDGGEEMARRCVCECDPFIFEVI